GAPLASGTFTFDESLDGGVLGYAHLTSFEINVRGVDYDLDYVLSGGPWVSHHFQFNTATDNFVSAGGFFPYYFAAVTAGSGFQVNDSTDPTVREFSVLNNITPSTYSQVEIDRFPVPEPASLALLAAGAVCLAPRRLRRVCPTR